VDKGLNHLKGYCYILSHHLVVFEKVSLFIGDVLALCNPKIFCFLSQIFCRHNKVEKKNTVRITVQAIIFSENTKLDKLGASLEINVRIITTTAPANT
jgi:hypothetical protein